MIELENLVQRNVKAGLKEPGEYVAMEDCYKCGYNGCKHDFLNHAWNDERFNPGMARFNPGLEGNMSISDKSTENTTVLKEVIHEDQDVKVSNTYIHHDTGPGRIVGPDVSPQPDNLTPMLKFQKPIK